MSIFDFIADSIEHLGSEISGTIDDTRRGVVYPNRFFMGKGNRHEAMSYLKSIGIDTWGDSGLGRDMSRITVHKRDRKRAMKALQDKGYEVW